ncbi:MAG: SMI1/KNR4 family protein [Flavobacteriales bacterium]|nr:MAG: SMI1/KNR4 family protein [Flavobacteriales bacterium]
MFNKLTAEEILEKFQERKSILKNIDNLQKLDTFYTSFVSRCDGLEITPDIIVFGYEEALKENKYLTNNYPNIGAKFWMIGRTGQGDEWFIDKASNHILFYDHNLGDYKSEVQLLNLEIFFLDFLQMAFLYQSLEDLLDEKEILDEAEQTKFITVINSIATNLYGRYPFKYW